ncbi:MAG: aspartate dehydrogenase [Rhodospirillaceae bacterium]
MVKLGLIGNGAIAGIVTRHCEASGGRLSIVGAAVTPEDGPSVGQHPTFVELSKVLALKPSLVIECAGQQAVQAHGPAILSAGIDLMIISVGALANDALTVELQTKAAQNSAKILIPAGALAGLDAIAAAKTAGLTSVSLTTRKPPHSWSGAPGVAGIDLGEITQATVLFTGTSRAAALAFPKNANVAAAVALAGLGLDDTKVELIADPTVSRNIHKITAEGAFGILNVEVQAEPSPDNPKTSYLAALSIMRQLDRLTETLVI